jgi:hypothetical protein
MHFLTSQLLQKFLEEVSYNNREVRCRVSICIFRSVIHWKRKNTFNHITKRKDRIDHWLYLSLADPTYYFFQTCLRSLRCPQQISSFKEKISEVDCRGITGGRTCRNKCPSYLQYRNFLREYCLAYMLIDHIHSLSIAGSIDRIEELETEKR